MQDYAKPKDEAQVKTMDRSSFVVMEDHARQSFFMVIWCSFLIFISMETIFNVLLSLVSSYPTLATLMEVFFAYETYQKHYSPYLVIYVYDLIG